jgi:hypothetical protein
LTNRNVPFHKFNELPCSYRPPPNRMCWDTPPQKFPACSLTVP